MIVEGTEDQPASALLVAREKKFLVAKVGLARKKRYDVDVESNLFTDQSAYNVLCKQHVIQANKKGF